MMNNSRRDFIVQSGKVMILMSGAMMFNQCGAQIRSNVKQMENESLKSGKLKTQQYDILRYASLAPNSHNSQPWIVKIKTPDHWILATDQTRWLPGVDPENRELLLSLGTFLENLTIAAEHYGYQVSTNVLASSRFDTDIAEINLQKADAKEYPLKRLELRRTLRSHYLDTDIKKEDLDFIMGDSSDQIHYFGTQTGAGKWLQEATIEANRVQACRDNAQEELADWIRWKEKDARKNKDGLTPASMEMGGFASWFVRHFYNCESVLSSGFREKTVEMVQKQVHQGGGWLVMTSPNSDISTLLDTGRTFEKMCLKLRERNLAVHPMTQILEETPFMNEVKKSIGIQENIQFVLRIGYVKDYPNPVSLRRPVDWFVQAI